MTQCIRGCIRRGQHRDDCDQHADCGHVTKSQRDQCLGGCRGCRPREATEGQLCEPCHTRMREWFSDGPNSIRAALGYLTDALRGVVSGISYDRDRFASDGPPVPLQLSRYDCRQLILDRIFVYEEAVREMFDRDQRSQPRPYALLGGVAWDRRSSTATATFEPIAGLRFLNSWLTKVEDAGDPDLLVEMWANFADAMILAHSLVPWRAEVRNCPDVPCPDCDRKQLVLYGGDDRVTCRYCGSLFNRDYYDRWTELISWQKAQAG